ncbi:MAG: hypothetical protein P8J78_11610 [Maricaulis sp.]|nr:hypothetical protein [Maricaulis sp.]
MNWAKKIKELRYCESIKQDAPAAQLGVSQASVSIWERGVSAPPRHVQETLRNLYGDGPSERLLEAIRASIVISPNPCALLVLRDGCPVIDARSQTGVLGDTVECQTETLSSVYGDEIEGLCLNLVESGLFDGAIRTATIVCNSGPDGRERPVRVSAAPFSLDQQSWWVRIDLRSLKMDDVLNLSGGEMPSISIVPSS